MTALTEVQRQIDTELDAMTGLLWVEEERVVKTHAGYSVVGMTHRINVRLEAELIRKGKLND
jgi:hypothetical protein